MRHSLSTTSPEPVGASRNASSATVATSRTPSTRSPATRDGVDPVAALAQRLDVLPDLGARDALVGGEPLSGADAALGAAQGFEHARRAALHRVAPPGGALRSWVGA